MPQSDSPGKILRWGILASGKICHDFCLALKTLPDARIVAVGARSLESAQKFGTTLGIPRQYGSYDELVRDPEVDIVYVGSMHHNHVAHSLLALRAGKHVVCEKPMALNADDAAQVLAEARKRKLFFVQGVWSRFFPAYKRLSELIRSGALGEVRAVQCSFGFNDDDTQTPRLQRRELAGGALLDIGIYAVQLASLAFGEAEPESVRACGGLNADGADSTVGLLIDYGGGRVANLTASISCELSNEATICGSRGAVTLRAPFWAPTELALTTKADGPANPNLWPSSPGAHARVESFPLPPVPSGFASTNFGNSMGFAYEAHAAMQCIRYGRGAPEEIDDTESIRVLRILDEARRQLGVVYPSEESVLHRLFGTTINVQMVLLQGWGILGMLAALALAYASATS